MTTNLILRTLISPFSDITRGSVLSHDDVDNNFIFLKGLSISSASLDGYTLNLNKINGENINLDLSPFIIAGNTIFTGGTFNESTRTLTLNNSTGGTINVTGITDTFITGGTYLNSTLTLKNSTGGTINVTGITDTFITGGTYLDSTLSLSNNSGQTIDINGFVKPVYGDRNQLQFVSGNTNSNIYYADDILLQGKYIINDAQLARAKSSFTSFSDIFNNWKRFVHGAYTNSPTSDCQTKVQSDLIPSCPLESVSWRYDSSQDLIITTKNSSSYNGVISFKSYSNYTLSLSMGATGNSTDNDCVVIVLAFVETDDEVNNNAHNLPFTAQTKVSGFVDTISQMIKNQHTLSVVRSRQPVGQAPFGLNPNESGSTRDYTQYFIVYNYGKLDAKLLTGLTNSQIAYISSDYNNTFTNMKVKRTNNVFETWSSNWSDYAGGVFGDHGVGLTDKYLKIDLNDQAFRDTLDNMGQPILEKFKGSARYGYGALSQKDATFKNVVFSDNDNNIYDLRNGDVWTANTANDYAIATGLTFSNDIRRFLYNPYENGLYYYDEYEKFSLLNQDLYITGGTFQNNTLSLKNNSGTTINVTGITIPKYYSESSTPVQTPPLANGVHSIAIGDGAVANDESFSIGTASGSGSTGTNNSIFMGYASGSGSTGNYVISIGNNAGIGNALSGVTIISNSSLPSYTNRVTAEGAITSANGAVSGNTYLYYNIASNAIEGVRL